MGIFDFFKKEKKLPWPKNEIIEKFEEELPDSVIRSVKIVSKLYDHAKDLNPLAQNSPKYFDNAEVTSKIEEILEKRIESNYKNYNPLNLREIYLRGSINKNFE